VPFAAIIFDMDGLLLDTERLAWTAFLQACGQHRLAVDRGFYDRLIGLNHAAAAPLLDAWLAGETAPSLHAFRASWDNAYHVLLDEGVPVKAGADILLAHLHDSGMTCAVATSTETDLAQQKLERAGLAPFLRGVVGGDRVAKGKPAPDIYLQVASQIAADPANCLAFEDSENGVRAALAAGMTVVQVPDLVAPSPDLRALGHDIEVSLLDAAVKKNLYPPFTPIEPL